MKNKAFNEFLTSICLLAICYGLKLTQSDNGIVAFIFIVCLGVAAAYGASSLMVGVKQIKRKEGSRPYNIAAVIGGSLISLGFLLIIFYIILMILYIV